jgi:uncharacterized protein YjbJ (UPF0337 family)
MNDDTVKGELQKIGGHIEEASGALAGDENLKVAGQEDQIKGAAREAWGKVKDAGEALVDRARAAKFDAEAKSEQAKAFDREHRVEVVHEEGETPERDEEDEDRARRSA